MALLYANENFPRPVVEVLRGSGHTVTTVQETGFVGQPMTDPEVLTFAASKGGTVVTLNRRHFDGEKPNHSGINVCIFDADFSGQAGRIDLAIKSESPLNTKLIRVKGPQK